MIWYEGIDKSEDIDFNKTKDSVKCIICNYYYFKDIGFKYQPYVYNACHDFNMIVQDLKDFSIVTILKILSIGSILQVLIKKLLFIF